MHRKSKDSPRNRTGLLIWKKLSKVKFSIYWIYYSSRCLLIYFLFFEYILISLSVTNSSQVRWSRPVLLSFSRPIFFCFLLLSPSLQQKFHIWSQFFCSKHKTTINHLTVTEREINFIILLIRNTMHEWWWWKCIKTNTERFFFKAFSNIEFSSDHERPVCFLLACVCIFDTVLKYIQCI